MDAKFTGHTPFFVDRDGMEVAGDNTVRNI